MESLVIDSSSGYNKGMSEATATISIIPDIDLSKLCMEVETAIGYKPGQMAKALGISFQTYYKWRSGIHDPNGQCTAKLFLLIKKLEKTGREIPITLK